MEKSLIGSSGLTREGPLAESHRERNVLVGLATLAIISEVLYVRLVRFNAIDGLLPVATFVGFMIALFAIYGLAFLLLLKVRRRRKAALAIIGLGAVLFRITMIAVGLPSDASTAELIQLVRADLHGEAVSFDRYLLYDDDIWRYLWDGHVWANSVNPFLLPPTDPALDFLTAPRPSGPSGVASPWQDIRENVNHAHVSTIYPPLAQMVFRLSHTIAPGSTLALKGILVTFDLLTVLIVRQVLRIIGSPPAWLLLYAWNPLLIKVVAASGHVDVLAGLFLALTAYLLLRRAYLPAAAALAGAALVKLGPFLLLPFLAKRIGWRRSLLAPLLMFVGYLPFLRSGHAIFAGFAAFARDWEFNSAFFLVMRWLAHPFAKDPSFTARIVGALAIVGCTFWAWTRDDSQPGSFPGVASFLLGALILFSPTVMPWYLVWLLPLAVMAQATIWVWFTGIVCLAFLVMVNGTLGSPILVTEYGALLMIAFVPLALRTRTKDIQSAAHNELQIPRAALRMGREVSHNNPEST